MSIIHTAVLVLGAFLLLVVLGYGAAFYLMPERYRRYVPLISPVTGLALVCLLGVVVSGNFSMSVRTSCVIAAVVLSAISVFAGVVHRDEFVRQGKSWLALAGLTAFAAAFAFWPLLHQGAGLYLGTSNPDFYQSLSLLEALERYHLPFFAPVKDVEFLAAEPFTGAFPVALQARFGAVVFGLLLDLTSNAGARTSLMTTVVVCMLCLPSTVHFFASAMLRMDDRAAFISGLLIAVSGPTAMSFLHIFLGQNSSLATLPFALTLLFLALRDLEWKLVVFATLAMHALWFLYVMMLPYVVAPLALYALYRLATGGWRYFARFLGAVGVLLASIALVHAGMAQRSVQFWSDLSALVGRMSQSHYYIDFLTEDFLVYVTGLSVYPISGNVFSPLLGNGVKVILMPAAFAVLGLYLYLLEKWRKTVDRDSAIAMYSVLAVYFAVWFHYSFLNLYGYASFKMSSWLQFALVPIMAFGVARVTEAGSPTIFRKKSAGYFVAALVLFFYVGNNVISSLDYEWKSYGRDRQRGLIINSFGLGGNPEIVEIRAALERLTRPGSVVSVAFPDSIANNWVAYYAYLAGRSVAVASHGLLPDHDSFLPDIKTGIVIDTHGEKSLDQRPYFRDGKADYYLVPGRSNLNVEIIDTPVKAETLWENGLARLVDASRTKDLVLTGRGFYRLEYFIPEDLAWWFPDRLRWSAEGGEILHFNPEMPGQPYQLSFVALAGHGLPDDTRTIEIFHNGEKIDERGIRAASRIVSLPYYPVRGLNKLVIRIREKTRPLLRRFGLWHTEIPLDWRLLNVAFSQVRVSAAGSLAPAAAPERMGWKGLLDRAVAFNGINIDGWLRDRGEFTLTPPPGSRGLQVKFLVPGIPEYSFPYRIKFEVNGRQIVKSVARAGMDTVDLPLEPSADGGQVSVSIEPGQFKRMPGVHGRRDLVQSIHLEELAFTSEGGK